MTVICDKITKKCSQECPHKKNHQYRIACNYDCHIQPNCKCISIQKLRKQKLEILHNINFK